MPRKTNTTKDLAPALPVSQELLDQLVPGPLTPAQFETLFRGLKKAVLERAPGAEQAHGAPRGNHRNGTTPKTVLTDDGAVRLEVPGDRSGPFEPQLIGKHERRFTGFDDKIIALYARGMTVREIQGYLSEMYAVEVSPDFISTVSEAVLAEVTAWQSRPLEPLYPVVFFDALRVKIREDAVVRNKAVYLALGVRADGTREILGLWIEQTKGAKFWLKVFNELRTRGGMDVLIAVVDGLKGLAEAIGTVFPQTTVPTCIVHLIRNSLDYVSWKDRKAVAAAIRPIYTAPTEAAAHAALDAFEVGPWGTKYAPISGLWRRAWNHVTPFFAFPPGGAADPLHDQCH